MSNAKILFVAGAACLMAGCNSKQVQMYAGKLDALLADYRVGVLSRMDAERKMYDQVSALFATEAERDVYEGLKIERQHQQRILTGDLADGRMEPSQIAEKLRETALAEFERTRAWFEQELTVQQQYQAGLARVTLDAKKLDVLDAALKAVEKNTGLKTALSDVVTLGTTFQSEFQLQNCKALEREVGITSDSIAELTAEKPDPADPAAGEALKKRIAALTASQAAVQAKLDASPNFKPTAADATKKTCQ
jgi:hypothetical protein